MRREHKAIEDPTAAIVAKIVEEQSIAGLTQDDRRTLAFFAAVQWLRSPGFRQTAASMWGQLRDLLIAGGAPQEQVEQELGLSQEELKYETARFTMKSSLQFASLIEDKTWLLCSTSSDHAYYISDSPVVLWNSTYKPTPVRPTIGLAVKGIEVHLPLSSTLCLGFICPSVPATIRDRYLKNVTAQWRHGARRPSPIEEPIKALLGACDSGEALHIDPGVVVNLNWQQVVYSERFLYSARDDFSLAAEIIARNPARRAGLKPCVGWPQMGNDQERGAKA